MRRLAVVFLGGLATATALGDDLLECVNPDVLSGLIFRSNSNETTSVSSEMPSEMAGVAVPASFQWIGSIDRNGRRSAAFKSNLSMDQASTAAIEALGGDGWAVREAVAFGGGAFGASPMPVSQTACRSGQAVNIAANDFDGTTYVTYGFAEDPFGTTCDRGDTRSPFGITSPLESLMPSFEFPPDPVTGRAFVPRGRSSGGGSQSRESSTEIELNDTLDSLAQFLAAQLPEQGWVADANWVGNLTAGSTWSRRAGDDATVQGTLEVTALGDIHYDVLFRIVQLD